MERPVYVLLFVFNLILLVNAQGLQCGLKTCSFVKPYCCMKGTSPYCTVSSRNCVARSLCGIYVCSVSKPYCCGSGKFAYCTKAGRNCVATICGSGSCTEREPYCCGRGTSAFCTANRETCQETSCGGGRCPASNPHCCKTGLAFYCAADSSECVSSFECGTTSCNVVTPFCCEINGDKYCTVSSQTCVARTQCGINYCLADLPYCCRQSIDSFCTLNEDICAKSSPPPNSDTTFIEQISSTSAVTTSIDLSTTQASDSDLCGDQECSAVKSHCCRLGPDPYCTVSPRSCVFKAECGATYCFASAPYCCIHAETPFCTNDDSVCPTTRPEPIITTAPTTTEEETTPEPETTTPFEPYTTAERRPENSTEATTGWETTQALDITATTPSVDPTAVNVIQDTTALTVINTTPPTGDKDVATPPAVVGTNQVLTTSQGIVTDEVGSTVFVENTTYTGEDQTAVQETSTIPEKITTKRTGIVLVNSKKPTNEFLVPSSTTANEKTTNIDGVVNEAIPQNLLIGVVVAAAIILIVFVVFIAVRIHRNKKKTGLYVVNCDP